MKTIPSILLLFILFGCNQFSGNDKQGTEDSLQYYPPTPNELSRQEFRDYHRKLSAYFDTMLLHKSFNGSILVAKNGAIVYEKYSGLINLDKNDSLSQHTPMHLASIGKTLTSFAILRLVQEKKLSLDDSLTIFFPALPYPGITVRMLLNHRSGLPNYVYFMSESDWDQHQYVTNTDVLNFLYTEQPKRSYPPDTHYNYCNTNFVLLAMIIEKITGLPFPEFMKQQIFTPLGMNDTYVFTLADSLRSTPSFNAGGEFWKNDFLEGTYGDKNIYSTVRDLLKFDQAIYAMQMVNQSLLDSAFKPYSNERPSEFNYGLGWHLKLLPNGKKIIFHFGRWHGFNSAFARLTDEKATIIILGNRFNRNIYNTAYRSYEIFGDYMQEPVKDEEEVDSVPPEGKKKNPLPKAKKTSAPPRKIKRHR